MTCLSSRTLLLVGLAAGCGTSAPPIGVDQSDASITSPVGGDGGTGSTTGSDSGSGTSTGVGADSGVIATPTANADGKCEIVQVDTGPVIPDMLIVLDRSGSMKQQGGMDCRMGVNILDPSTYLCIGIDCTDPANANSASCGGSQLINRWDPSVSALKTVTSTLDDRVSFGLMMFPDPSQTGRNGSCAVGDVLVPEALNTSGAIANALNNAQPGGGTPTGPALEKVLARVKAKEADVDIKPAPQYVLLVTDGQPTCPNGGGGGGNGANADRALTTKTITDLHNAGVTTYVLGYDAQLDTRFEGALNEFAQAGGTDHYRPVGDEASLVTEIESITKRIASCTYRLASAPADPKYVLVTLDKQPLPLNDANGWMIHDRDVTIVGSACATLQDGTAHALNVTVQCEVVVLK